MYNNFIFLQKISPGIIIMFQSLPSARRNSSPQTCMQYLELHVNAYSYKHTAAHINENQLQYTTTPQKKKKETEEERSRKDKFYSMHHRQDCLPTYFKSCFKVSVTISIFFMNTKDETSGLLHKQGNCSLPVKN